MAAGCILAVGLIAAGCGGGDSTGTTGASGASGASGSTPLSEEEFVSQANAICQDANEQIQALQPPPDNASVTDLVPFLTEGYAIARAATTKLEALTPPSELQSQRDKLVANTDKETALTEQLIAAAKDNDTAKVESLSQQLNALDSQDNEISKSIGLTECAKDVNPQG